MYVDFDVSMATNFEQAIFFLENEEFHFSMK